MTLKEINIYKRILATVILAVMFTGLFSRCANIATPQGGPLDSLPPKTVLMTPAYGTTDFKGDNIYIEFDEYVRLNDQQKEFFTSPLMEEKPVLMLRGRGIRIDLKEKLDSNRTYSLNFGQSVVDNNEGNVYVGLRYVFSTGPHIDSMLISGYAIDAKTADSASNVFIYLYENSVDSMRPHPDYDSTLLKYNPHSVARSFPNGLFMAENLKPVDYRVYALEDKNGNMKYDPGVDKAGFIDSVINPSKMPPFDMWFDTTRNYMVVDPQMLVSMFTDDVFKRQNLTSPPSRPLKNKLIFDFLGPFPQIDTLRFDGVEPEDMTVEYLNPTRDSIAYWLSVPPDQLPDTLTGRLAYQRHDSLGNLYTHGEDIRAVWKAPAQPQRERNSRREKQEEDTVKVNPFKVTVIADKELIPEKEIIFEFDYPLARVDSAAILLERTAEAAPAAGTRQEGRLGANRPTPGRNVGPQAAAGAAGTEAVKTDVKFVRDTMAIRKWYLRADWKPEEKYRLTIPAGTFENVLGETNDTLRSDFSIDVPEKYATLVLNIKGKTPESKYVLTIYMGQSSKELKDISSGTHTIRYVTPGDVRLKILEDMNGNGVWDAGSLVQRRQSERTEIFFPDKDSDIIPARENWEVEYDMDMNEIFKPVDMEYLREVIGRIEEKRAKARAEELEKKAEEERKGTGTSSGRAERTMDRTMQSTGRPNAQTGRMQ